MWRGLASRHGVRLAIIECVLGDEAVHAARLAGRERGLALPEPTWADVQRRRTEWAPWPEPHLTLDSTESVDANVRRALDYLNEPDDTGGHRL